jgi:hypothetical protein
VFCFEDVGLYALQWIPGHVGLYALQWIPEHCQIAGKEHADALARKCAKFTQKHIRESSCHSIKLHLKQLLQIVYRHELETKLFQKPWKLVVAKIPDWPRRKADTEFRLCFGHDRLGTHLHRSGIRPDSYCTLCSLREHMDRNHLGQCTAILNRTECEQYWEARAKNDGKLTLFLLYYYFCNYSL